MTVIAAPDKAGVALGQCYVSSSPSLPAYLPLSARSLSLSLSHLPFFPRFHSLSGGWRPDYSVGAGKTIISDIWVRNQMPETRRNRHLGCTPKPGSMPTSIGLHPHKCFGSTVSGAAGLLIVQLWLTDFRIRTYLLSHKCTIHKGEYLTEIPDLNCPKLSPLGTIGPERSRNIS